MNLKGLAFGFLVVACTALATAIAVHARFGKTIPTAFGGERQPVVGADTIHTLAQPLLRNPDANTRLEIAKTLRDLAKAPHGATPGPREPQTVDILGAAFARETDSRVKIEIVNTLSEFSIPEAAELLNRALEDGDPAVRDAAQQAKIRRERRMLFARCCE